MMKQNGGGTFVPSTYSEVVVTGKEKVHTRVFAEDHGNQHQNAGYMRHLLRTFMPRINLTLFQTLSVTLTGSFLPFKH